MEPMTTQPMPLEEVIQLLRSEIESRHCLKRVLLASALHHLEAGKRGAAWMEKPTGPGLWWFWCPRFGVRMHFVYDRNDWKPHGLCVDDSENTWEDSPIEAYNGLWQGPLVKPEPPATPPTPTTEPQG
jgi:hypothetical protein